MHLLADLRRMISINTGKARETNHLFQRISVSVQRFNAVLLHDSLPASGVLRDKNNINNSHDYVYGAVIILWCCHHGTAIAGVHSIHLMSIA